MPALRDRGAVRLRVRGRGDDRPDSDVDLLYVSAPDVSSGLEIVDLHEALEALLGRQVDLVPEQGPPLGRPGPGARRGAAALCRVLMTPLLLPAVAARDALRLALEHRQLPQAGEAVRTVHVVSPVLGAVVFYGVLVGPQEVEIAGFDVDPGYRQAIAGDPED